MAGPRIRPMLPDDVDAATEMVLAHGWGVRREWLAFAATQPQCSPLVADLDGAIVATGVGTANGPAGWIGSIFVDERQRGRGLGRAITQEIIDRLEASGCRTLVLVATSEGRRLYERMAFEVQQHYRILEIEGLPPAPADGHAVDPGGPGVRAFEAADLEAMARLDRAATGEDRGHALARLASPSTARVLARAGGSIGGFVVRPPWGGGATVAATIEDAEAIIEARRRSTGPEGRTRVGLLDANRAGIERLGELGFRQAWSAPRMMRGEPLDWHPEQLWGQFNHAMG